MIRGFINAALTSVLLLTLSACDGGENNVSTGNRSGILHFGNHSEPQGLDPHSVTGVPEHHILQALFEGLVTKNPYSLDIEPAVAERWSVSNNGRLYTFHLRKNARWSNGDAVTAEDFRWAWWRALQAPLGNQYVFMFFPIKNAERYFKQEISDFSKVGIQVIDKHTLNVELKNPTPYFLQLLDHYSMSPIHRATIEKFGKADESYTRWTRPGNLVGNGPFILKEWRLNKHLTVRRNPLYWGNDSVKLNGINFYPTENLSTEERMFRAGQLHRTEDIPIDRIKYYQEKHPELLHIAPYMATYFYRINTTKPNLADKRVRQALAQSIDRRTLIDAILSGIFTPAYAVTPPNLLGYQPPQTFAYDPESAQALLAQAGYPNGDNFPEIELQYNSHEQHRKIAIAIQQMWKDNLNITVRLQNKDWKVYLDDETTGNYDISRASWIGDYLDPNSFLDIWTSDSGINRTGWSSSEYDKKVLRDAPTATNKSQRFKHFYDAEKILFDNMPIIPVYTYASKHLLHPSVKGMPANLMDYYNYRYVSLEVDSNEARQ